MAKRDTVKLDRDKIDILRKANQWNQSAFSRKVGKYSSWYSEVLRDKNLPSPEEAAHICRVFDVSPDDILLHEGETPEETAKCLKDIETVRKLVEAEGIKKAPDPKTEGEDIKVSKAINFVRGASPDEISEIENFFAYLESKRKNNETKS